MERFKRQKIIKYTTTLSELQNKTYKKCTFHPFEFYKLSKFFKQHITLATTNTLVGQIAQVARHLAMG